MSKESYLKGEKKLKAITIIKTGLGVRMNVSEILQQLQKNGIDISKRTYRRLKLEIYQSAGGTVSEVFRKHVGGTFFNELLSFEEMEKQCWKLYNEVKNPSEKLRVISQLRLVTQDKMRITKNLPPFLKSEPLYYPRLCDDLKEFDKGDPPTEPE